MDEIMKKNLLKGERILWEGQAEPFKLGEKAGGGTKAMVQAVIGTVIALGLTIWYILMAGKLGVPVKVLALVIFLGLPGVAAYAPISDRRAIGKARYVLTNCRAIVYNDSGDFGSYHLTPSTRVRTVPMENGASIVAFGGACAEEHIKNARILVTKFGKGSGGMTFYSVKDADRIAKLVKEEVLR